MLRKILLKISDGAMWLRLATACLAACLTAAFMFYPAKASGYPYSYVLMEGGTGTLLYSENGWAPIPPYHSAKLMTLLLCCEAIESGSLSLDSEVVVSKNANSMQGAQIWLDVGEKIAVSELIASITVGNANDACMALAEAVGGSEEVFLQMMNSKAGELGMQSTVYADPTGTKPGSITTACDTAILASSLIRFEWLREYFTTWMTSVRDGRAELVSQNRLVRSYNGITGMKAYSGEDCGDCLIASSERNGLSMICVILGETDGDRRFSTAKEKMNIGYLAYRLYTPRLKDIFLEPVRVKNGVKSEVAAVSGELKSFIIRSGRENDIEISYEYENELEAPVYSGDRVGSIVYSLDGEELYRADILAGEEAARMNILLGAVKILRTVFAS